MGERGGVGGPAGDADALADAMARVLDDEALRMRLAREAQRRALAEDADHTAGIFEAMYRVVTAIGLAKAGGGL